MATTRSQPLILSLATATVPWMRNWAATSPVVAFGLIFSLIVVLEVVIDGRVWWLQAIGIAVVFTVALTIVAEVQRRKR